jgi:hypothetical protein
LTDPRFSQARAAGERLSGDGGVRADGSVDPAGPPAGRFDPRDLLRHGPLDSIGVALLVVLDRMRPAERPACVLHDIFAVPFAQIAPIVDRPPGWPRCSPAEPAAECVAPRPPTRTSNASVRSSPEDWSASARTGEGSEDAEM